jgi:hypothetical protein
VQHTGRIANATAIERHLNNLVFDLRRLTGVGIVEQEGAALAGLLPAAVALLAFRTLAVSDDIDSITMWTVEYQGNHDPLIRVGAVILQQRISDPQFYNTFSDLEAPSSGGGWGVVLGASGMGRGREQHLFTGYLAAGLAPF